MAINDEQWVVTITDNTKEKGVYYKFTEYEVKTTTPNGIPTTVLRRYKDFRWLQQDLLRLVPHYIIPCVPPKKRLKRFDHHFILFR